MRVHKFEEASKDDMIEKASKNDKNEKASKDDEIEKASKDDKIEKATRYDANEEAFKGDEFEKESNDDGYINWEIIAWKGWGIVGRQKALFEQSSIVLKILRENLHQQTFEEAAKAFFKQ